VAELIRPGDVIVSFNRDFMIDLVVEDDPRNLSIAYTYRLHSDSVTLLKPHGSIDWFEEDKLPDAEMQRRASGVRFYPSFHLAENPDLVDSPALRAS
jgi:hypothetical protein